MRFLEKLFDISKKVFKWIFSDFKNLLITALAIAAICFYFNYKSVKSEYDNFIISTNDTILVYKNKAGELYAQNKAYITDIENLKMTNTDLYNEVKNLKDNPLVVTKTVFKTVYEQLPATTDSLTTTIENGDSIYKSNFSYKDDWTFLKGYTTFNTFNKSSSTFFDNITIASDLTMDLIEKKNNLYIIAKSSNPHLQINNTEGYIVSPEKSKMLKNRFNKPWGVMVGVGPSVTIIDNKIKFVPSLQLTIGYKFISF